jgi:outer membrane protein
MQKVTDHASLVHTALLVGSMLLGFGRVATARPPAAPRVQKQKHPRSAQSYSLKKCIRTALVHRPELQAQTAREQAAAGDVHLAKKGYFPTLNFNAGYQRLRFSYNPRGAGKPPGDDRNDWVVGTTLRYPLFSGFATAARVRAAESLRTGVRLSTTATRRRVILEVIAQYYTVLQRTHQHRLLEANLKKAKLHKALARTLLEVGKGARTDVLRAQVALSRAKLMLTRAETQTMQARANLKKTMGLGQDHRLKLIDPGLHVEPRTFARLSPKRRPEQARVQKALAARRHLESAAKNDFWPSLFAVGSIEWHQDRFFPRKTNWYVGLSLEIPLFDYYGLAARLKKARAAVFEARSVAKQVDQNVALEQKKAYLELQQAQKELSAAETLQKSATANLKLAEESYRLGSGSMLELSDARAAYFLARAEVIKAVFEAKIHQATYRHAMGREVRP